MHVCVCVCVHVCACTCVLGFLRVLENLLIFVEVREKSGNFLENGKSHGSDGIYSLVLGFFFLNILQLKTCKIQNFLQPWWTI